MLVRRTTKFSGAGQMLRWWLVAVVLVAALSVPSAIVGAQQVTLSGTVLLDGKETPLANADIQIAKLNLSVRSDSLGKFTLSGIPAGRHQVLVRLVGHEPVTIDWDFRSAQPGEADFILKPNVTKLSEVKVKDTKTTGRWAIKLAEFDERRASGIGKFLTADYFESQDGRPLSSFIQQKIAGINLVQKSGRRFMASSRGCGLNCPVVSIVSSGSRIPPGDQVLPKACYMQVVVNGIIRFSGVGQPPFDLDEIQSSDIIGLEFYTVATAPLQFRNSTPASMCGTVAIWTKGG